MKYKIITKTLFVLFIMACTISTSSCSQEEENLFDESAALRLNKSTTEATDLLQSSENGWIMEYFPNTASAGFTYLVKFPSTKVATFATINQYVTTYKEADGFWRVINDMGPVLTFDTYNDIFHIFADPAAPGTSDGDGVGLNGDYEFLVINKTADMVTLKGKKHGAITILRKLAAGQQWNNYFAKLQNIDKSIFSTNVDTLKLICNSDTISTFNGISHIFSFLKKGADPVYDIESVPFIVTDEGVRLYAKYKFNNHEFQNFKFNSDSTKLVSSEDNSVFLQGPVLNKYLKASNSTWKMDTTDMSANFKNRLRSLIAGMKTAYPTRSFEYFGLSSKTTLLNSFVLKITGAEAAFRINFTCPTSSTIKLSLPTETTNLYDNNGKSFYSKTTEIATTLTYFCAEYKVSTKKPFVVGKVRYEKTDNPNEYFTVYR